MTRSSCAVSVVIATADRDRTLLHTLESLSRQNRVPDEVVVVDGAPAPGVEPLVRTSGRDLRLNIVYARSAPPSAATQRNIGVARASGDILVFLDDDAYPEYDCLERLLEVFEADAASRVGGAGALIRNQPCHAPSPRAKRWFDFLADERRTSYAGMVIGPAIPVGPEPTDTVEIRPVDWLMSTCVAYRRAALPPGPFNSTFVGYSYMEDVDLSLRVRRGFELVVHTGAYVFHDSQPSRFKAPYVRARMIVKNRYHVMTVTLGRTTLSHHVRFLASLLVPHLTSLRSVRGARDIRNWATAVGGTISGVAGLALARTVRAGLKSTSST